MKTQTYYRLISHSTTSSFYASIPYRRYEAARGQADKDEANGYWCEIKTLERAA